MKSFLLDNKLPIFIGTILFAVAFFLRIWRFSSAPDIFGDEVLYDQIAINLPVYGQLMAWGKPWFVHSPLYYLVQSVFFQWMGINEVTLANVFTARLLASLCSALTVLVVFVWIKRVSDCKIGAISVALLMLEPYALKYGRIGILESMAMLFIVISLYVFWKANEKGGLGRYVLAGVFFGLALLTKELAIFLFVPIAIWWLLTRYVLKEKVDVKGVSIFVGTALLMYSGYVIWALSIDASAFLHASPIRLQGIRDAGYYISFIADFLDASSFLHTKFYLFQRIFWIIKDTGYTHPGYISFMSDFMETAHLYVATYILLAIAPFACLYLILREKNRSSILLVSWLIGSAIFFLAIGIRNPQFFTYIIVPAVVVDGYALSKIYFEIRKGWKSGKPLSYLIASILAILVVYNAGVWYNLYGVGTDDAFSQSILWTEANVPKETKIVVVYTYEYFLKDYKLYNLEALDNVNGLDIHYFITSPRWTYAVDTDLLEYLRTKGNIIGTFYGTSLREINIYYVEPEWAETTIPTPMATLTPTPEPTSTPASMAMSVPTPEPTQTFYEVKRGDWLYEIARGFYGGGWRQWRTIYEANRGIIQNPSLIYPGQVLVIPK